MRKPTPPRTRGTLADADPAQPRCGLCGKTQKLMQTRCCGQWICDDADQYVLFSYAHNSCARNHDRYTLCASHFNEGHAGAWQSCQQCREMFETEMYVWYGTNAYNFERLANPPTFEPTRCSSCNNIIRLSTDGYSITAASKYLCQRCTAKSWAQPSGVPRTSKKR